MMAEPYRQSIFIAASPEHVFRHFTDPTAITAWMGDAADVEPSPGGRFILRFAERVVEGRYLVVDPPRRLVISWGRHGSRDFAPGSSRLEVRLTPEAGGTRVTIVHRGLPAAEERRHAAGWQHYLHRLSAAGQGLALAPHHVPASLTEGVDEV